MPLPVGFSVITTRLIGSYQGQIVENVLHYLSTNVGLDPDAVQGSLESYWRLTGLPAIAANQSFEYTWTGIETQLWRPDIGFSTRHANESIAGASEMDGLPSETAFIVKKLSGLIGRANRGRVYISGLPYNAFDQAVGTWGAGTITAMGAAGAVFKTTVVETVSGSNMTPCVINKAFTHFAFIVTVGTNPAPRSQRRRQIGVGK